MKRYIKFYLLILLAGLFTACEDNLLEGALSVPAPPPEVPATSGDADFTNYVSLGNSLTAGFMDGALYNRGQQNSFPSLLAGQMAQAVDNASQGFNQPDINSENGFFGFGPGGVVLGRLKLNSQSLPQPTVPGDVPGPYTGDKSQLNNFGVPGILLGQLLIPETGNPQSPAFNPLYARFATAPGQSTILTDALATQPTFFTLWIGNNDVLGYAVSGATNESIFTDPQTFGFLYGQALGALAQSGAQGVVANIPNVTDIPYFKLVPNNALELSAAEAAQLNQGYTLFNGAVAQYNSIPNLPEDQKRPTISFQEGANLFVIRDEDLPQVPGLPSIRHMTAEELVGLTIPQDSVLYWHTGVVDPANPQPGEPDLSALGVPSQYILTTNEISEVTARTQELNQIIAQTVAQYDEDMVLLDMNSVFADFASNGVARYYGVTLDPGVAPPFGAFSLDGVHPNARGYAYVANLFIDAINAKFGSTLKYVPMEGSPINDFPPQ